MYLDFIHADIFTLEPFMFASLLIGFVFKNEITLIIDSCLIALKLLSLTNL